MTTSDYLTQLEQDREDFVDNLEAKGITGLTGDETFTELVPEILNIPSGGGNLQSKSVSITSNGITNVVADSGYDGLSDVTITTNVSTSFSQFNGSYDVEGLRAIGYSNNEINHLQKYAVFWDSNDDTKFQLTASELAGDESSNTRYLPHTSTITSFSNYNRLMVIPETMDLGASTNLSSAFANCYNLRYIKGLFINGQTTSMASMFSGCYTLRRMSFKSGTMIQLQKITTMASMFNNCRDLLELDFGGVRSVNTAQLASFGSMFSGCSSLRMVNMSSIYTKYLTTCTSMFSNCVNIEEIDISKLSISSSATSLSVNNMFNNCYSLKKIDMRSLDFSKITANTTNSFLNVPSDCLIIVKDATAKTWFSTNWPNLTNVKLPSEL